MQFMGFALMAGRPTAAPSRTEGWSIHHPVKGERPPAVTPPSQAERKSQPPDDELMSMGVSRTGSMTPANGTGHLDRSVREDHRWDSSCEDLRHSDTLIRRVREESRDTHSMPYGPEGHHADLHIGMDAGADQRTGHDDSVLAYRVEAADDSVLASRVEAAREPHVSNPDLERVVQFYQAGPLWRRPAERVRSHYSIALAQHG